MNTRRFAAAAVLPLSLVACGGGASREASTAGADVRNAVSPLEGSWSISGDAPAPKANLPTFVRLNFKSGGALEASYVAAGGALAHVIGTPSKLKVEHDRYVLGDKNQLEIVEGSRSLEYAYEVRDGRLILTQSGDATGTVYRKDG